MLQTDLPYPGLIPNAPRLRNEAARAVSYIEIQSDLRKGPAPQGAELRQFFLDLVAYIDDKKLAEPAAPAPEPTKKGK